LLSDALERTNYTSVAKPANGQTVNRRKTRRSEDMTTTLRNLLEKIEDDPRDFLIFRDQQNYGLFLDLYQNLGYAPKDPNAFAAWQSRSRETWVAMDQVLPQTCTGGLSPESLASAAGTLPISTKVTYGHSYCMTKTPEGAVTLYAQSLHSLAEIERYPSTGYWAGSYNSRSRFTPLFQRPTGITIPGQLEIEALLCVPLASKLEAKPFIPDIGLEIVSSTAARLLRRDADIFGLLQNSHPALGDIHSVRTVAVCDLASGKTLAIAIIPEVLPEFTAINVFSWLWIFPIEQQLSIAELCLRLRKHDEFRTRSLNFATRDETLLNRSLMITNEQPVRRFWAFTPREHVPQLRESFRLAFSTLFDKFTEPELARESYESIVQKSLTGG
jgi:hypothetical protein